MVLFNCYLDMVKKRRTRSKFKRNGQEVFITDERNTDNINGGTLIGKEKLGFQKTKKMLPNDIISIGSEDFPAFAFTMMSNTAADDSLEVRTTDKVF